MEGSSTAVERLLREAGFPAVEDWSPVRGGANNRVFCGTADSKKVLLKLYFHDPLDSRDRLRGERCFYSFAEKACPAAAVPGVLGWDLENRLGLFEFIEGRKLEVGEIATDLVLHAARLVSAVNDLQDISTECPLASEACFSILDHLSTVDARVERLQGLQVSDSLDHEGRSWVHDELAPTWKSIRETALSNALSARLDPSACLPSSQRWISPSDFGFHNALLEKNGCLKFFDFEYAGLDDPAKLVADFFCQPAIPVPTILWRAFLQGLAECCRWYPDAALRAQVLLPAYRVKWCCIMMNEFLATAARRRSFSGIGAEDRRAAQLAKARAALCEIDTAF